MKKITVFILYIVLCLSLVSCINNANNNPNTQAQNGTNTEANDSSTDKDTNIEQEYVPDESEDNSMFIYPDDPAKYVVDYMRNMATIKWTPKKTFHLFGEYQAWNYNLTYEEGKTYSGPPFLVHSRGSMQAFLGSIEDGVYVGGTSHTDCIGSACYDAVFVSLIQVCPSIKFKSTEDMLPKNNTGLVAVGNWDSNISKRDTSVIINETSKETMANSYAQLLAGDVLLKHIVAQDAGHARIVAENPHIVYTENNKIDLENSYVITIEQTNLWDNMTDNNTTWWVNRKYTFKTLIETFFVPLRPIDYTKELSPAYIKSDNLTSGDKIANATKLEGVISSNQYMTEIQIQVTDDKNTPVYKTSVYPNSKSVDLNDIEYTPTQFNHTKGTYKFTLKASLATGTKTLADYTFIVE